MISESENAKFLEFVFQQRNNYLLHKEHYDTANKLNMTLLKKNDMSAMHWCPPESTSVALLTLLTFFPDFKKKLDKCNEYPDYKEGEDPRDVSYDIVQTEMNYVVTALEKCVVKFFTGQHDDRIKLETYVSDVCKVMGFHYEQNFQRTKYSNPDFSKIKSIVN